MNPRTFRLKSLTLAGLLLALCLNAAAQQPATARADAARVERLMGLAKVWGTVKYFHPYLASREIDWDKALIETIPKVNAAKTPQEYQAALNQMLAVLNDKSTRAELVADTKPAAVAGATAKPVRMENGILIIDATQIAQAVAA